MSNNSISNNALHARFLSILVTSANTAVADNLCAMLNACGHATTQVTEHVDGLRVMESFVFDVLVIASENENATSLAFAVASKNKCPDMAVVWIGQHGSAPTLLAKSIVDVFLAVPFTLEQLNDCVCRQLALPHSQ